MRLLREVSNVVGSKEKRLHVKGTYGVLHILMWDVVKHFCGSDDILILILCAKATFVSFIFLFYSFVITKHKRVTENFGLAVIPAQGASPLSRHML